ARPPGPRRVTVAVRAAPAPAGPQPARDAPSECRVELLPNGVPRAVKVTSTELVVYQRSRVPGCIHQPVGAAVQEAGRRIQRGPAVGLSRPYYPEQAHPTRLVLVF